MTCIRSKGSVINLKLGCKPCKKFIEGLMNSVLLLHFLSLCISVFLDMLLPPVDQRNSVKPLTALCHLCARALTKREPSPQSFSLIFRQWNE